MKEMRRRSGEDPTRRIVAAGSLTDDLIQDLQERAKYVGSGHHKRKPLDYGFERTNPRPTKSLCDAKRSIKLDEAKSLLAAGIQKGMISRALEGDLPKYIWSVSDSGEPFEAKTSVSTPGMYHGYPLEDNDRMGKEVLEAWKQR